ncbi:MAG TPA: homocysteine S-methyltransferase family protein [Chloroflexota bacterium]|nr:homocysteine S-methyltransferase family protein [Chloroflexota bacterium]
MNNLLAKLPARGVVLTDGAWGTEMQARGLPIGGCPDAWNIERPECVEAIAKAYVEAGSQVILTNTFGANHYVLRGHGYDDRVQTINRRGAEISRRAAGSGVKVFASVGPTGQSPADVSAMATAVYEAFMEQARSLADGGADAIVVETMSDLNEAKLAVRAAKTTGLPVVACMLYIAGRQADRTLTAVTPEQAAAELANAGADAIGTNCGIGAEAMLPICVRLRAATALPVWIKPNAGLPDVVDGRAVYRTTPEQFATSALALVRSGAAFIGGCCGTDPHFIEALARAVRTPHPDPLPGSPTGREDEQEI